MSDDDAIVPSDLRLTDDSRADSGKGVNLINGDHRVIKHVASTAGSTELGKRRQAELGNAAAAMQARCGHVIDQRQRMIQQTFHAGQNCDRVNASQLSSVRRPTSISAVSDHWQARDHDRRSLYCH